MANARFELSNELLKANRKNKIWIEKDSTGKFFLKVEVEISALSASLSCTPEEIENCRETDGSNIFITNQCAVEMRKIDLKNKKGASVLRLSATVGTKVPGTGSLIKKKKK